MDYAIWPSLVVKRQDRQVKESFGGVGSIGKSGNMEPRDEFGFFFFFCFLFITRMQDIPMPRMNSAESPIICLAKSYDFRSYHQLLEDKTVEGRVLLWDFLRYLSKHILSGFVIDRVVISSGGKCNPVWWAENMCKDQGGVS